MNSTRIRWLEKAYQSLREELLPEAPEKINISFGFPSQGHLRSKYKTIGEHWSGFTDGSFISLHPLLGMDPVNMLAVLVHEMIHSAFPEDGHRGKFPKTAKRVGLVGKMTATVPGHDLLQRLNSLNIELGPFPPGSGDLVKTRKQSTRLIKLVCQCSRILRASRDEIKRGPVICSLCNGHYQPLLGKFT